MMDICKDVHQPDHVYIGRDLLFLDVNRCLCGFVPISTASPGIGVWYPASRAGILYRFTSRRFGDAGK